jgi:hypothetical protein
MKNILIIALTLIAFAANAQTPATKETSKATISVNVSQSTPAIQNETPATAPTALGAPDNSAKFVGTNDLNISLLREGVKKA